MISKKTNRACCEDFSNIANYEEASTDTKQMWLPYRKNLLTQVGRLKPELLKALGMFYKRPANELQFIPKNKLAELESRIPLSDKPASRLHLVFKFFHMLHPDKMFSELDEEEFDRISRSVARLRILFNQMKARCYNPNAQDYHYYGAKGVRICDEWLKNTDNFVAWSLQNGYTYYPEKVKGDQLSLDRIDSNGDYCPENCRFIPHRVNCGLAARKKGGTIGAKNRKFGKTFPLAVGYRKYVDWGKVLRIYFMNDGERFKRYLKKNGYCATSIWRICRPLGLIEPQTRKNANG